MELHFEMSKNEFIPKSSDAQKVSKLLDRPIAFKDFENMKDLGYKVFLTKTTTEEV